MTHRKHTARRIVRHPVVRIVMFFVVAALAVAIVERIKAEYSTHIAGILGLLTDVICDRIFPD